MFLTLFIYNEVSPKLDFFSPEYTFGITMYKYSKSYRIEDRQSRVGWPWKFYINRSLLFFKSPTIFKDYLIKNKRFFKFSLTVFNLTEGNDDLKSQPRRTPPFVTEFLTEQQRQFPKQKSQMPKNL